MTEPGWTSLEVVKLIVGALTPLAVVGLGFFVDRRLRRVEAVQWANQTVVTRRVEIFTEVAPKLNRLLCFATFVGRWKEITPQQAITLKRELDETMYANRVLFSDELFSAYQTFMATAFATFAVVDADALLRAHVATQWGDRRNLRWWDESMLATFAEDPAPMSEIETAYHELGQRFRADLYVTHTTRPLLTTPDVSSGEPPSR